MGSIGGMVLLAPAASITTTSDKRKNSDIKDMYSLTHSRAMVRHCVGLRLLPDDDYP